MHHNSIKENYIVLLSNRCFDMLQDQINKIHLMIATWLSVFVAVFALIYKESGPTETQKTMFLWILFILSVLCDFAIVTVAIWQSRYKKACTVVTQLIMSGTDLSKQEEVWNYIKSMYALQHSKQTKSDLVLARAARRKSHKGVHISTTNIIIFFCHLMPLVPIVFMVERNDNMMIYVSIIAILSFIYVTTMSILHRYWARKQRNTIPWILRIS